MVAGNLILATAQAVAGNGRKRPAAVTANLHKMVTLTKYGMSFITIMTKVGPKLPETGTRLRVIRLHDALCPLGADTDPNRDIRA